MISAILGPLAFLIAAQTADTAAAATVDSILSADSARTAATALAADTAHRVDTLHAADSSRADTVAGAAVGARALQEAQVPAPGPAKDSAVAELPEAVIKARKAPKPGVGRMRSVEGAGIYDGKKTEVIYAGELTANTAANNARQIFARVPGVNVWESDGGGLQMGVGARGLSPKRTSEFNTRLNGYDLSADALGYPESYYTPPMEGLERIEVVRGAASLQYGTQFGGMINFAMKKGPKDRAFQAASRQTGGSNGFWNSFNSVAGQAGPANYYAFYQHKQGEDFRPNSAFGLDGAYFSNSLALSPKLTLSVDLTVMRYLARQPGGLTDAQFRDDPYQAVRSRNWFGVDWNLAAGRLEYKPSEATLWDFRTFGLSAGREALGVQDSPDRPDVGQPRDLLKDDYRNLGAEARWLRRFTLGGRAAAALVGGRMYRGSLERSQGIGVEGSGPVFRFRNPDSLQSEHRFPSRNNAVFAEAIIPVSDRVNLTPGARLEHIATEARGRYRNDEIHPLTGEVLQRRDSTDDRARSRVFPLFGLGLSWFHGPALEGYANVSRNYKAINFNDMRVIKFKHKVDPNLEDETGFNADLGARGNIRGWLDYDVSVFWLAYDGRIGKLPFGGDSTRTTNISDSRNVGLEAFAELDMWRWLKGDAARSGFSGFLNLTWLDARYVNSSNSSVRNKRVELVPDLLVRTGLNWKRDPLRVSWQTAYTGDQYTEATNATFTTKGINGLVPAYTVSDASAKLAWKGLALEGGCDNVFDEVYFSRRADAYPGPGIIPSPGRTFYLTLGASL